MYFDFLQDQIIDWPSDDDPNLTWCMPQKKFIKVVTPSLDEITRVEQRLLTMGYHLPVELKAFWSEIGCGYFENNDLVDNGLELPQTDLDIYFCEGAWTNLKLHFNIFDSNEFPFFLTNNLDYITIGLEEGVNLGKIYHFGQEIAPNLIEFIKRLLENPSYYINYEAAV